MTLFTKTNNLVDSNHSGSEHFNMGWIAEMFFGKNYRLIQHVLFWIVVYNHRFIALFFESSAFAFVPFLNLGIDMTATIFMVYFNLYYLLPRLIDKTRIQQYAFFTLLFIVLAGYISVLVQYGDCYLSCFTWVDFIYQTCYKGIVVGGALGIKLLKYWYQKSKTIRELELQKSQTELKFLKTQINPHFLFNSLNNIYVMHCREMAETANTIDNLNELLKYQLIDCSKTVVSLEGEINYIKNYLQLELLRKSDVTTHFELVNLNEIELEQIYIQPLILISVVENAVKHGRKNVNGNFINIRVEVFSGKLIFTVENSKREISRTSNQPGGIGLVNVKKRLSLLYPEAHAVNIIDNDLTYKVELKFPYMVANEWI